MTIPPLYQCILNAGKNHVTLEPAYRHFDRVNDVQYGNSDEGGDVKPNSYIQVPFAALNDGAEHIDAKNYPNNSDGNIYRPLQLGILVRGSKTKRKCNYCR